MEGAGPRAKKDVFTDFYRWHYPAVRSFASHFVDVSNIDDAVSDTFVVGWRRFSEIPDEWPRAWLFGVVKNVARSQRRSHGRANAFRERLVFTSPPITSALHDGRLDPGTADVLSAALRRLVPGDQEVLLLSVWYEMSAIELAVALGVSTNTATVRLHRAKSRLREVFGDEQNLNGGVNE